MIFTHNNRVLLKNRAEVLAPLADFCCAPTIHGAPIPSTAFARVTCSNADLSTIRFEGNVRELRIPQDPAFQKLRTWTEGFRQACTALLLHPSETALESTFTTLTGLRFRPPDAKRISASDIRTLFEKANTELRAIIFPHSFADREGTRLLSRAAEEKLHFVCTRSEHNVRNQFPHLATELLDLAGFVLRRHFGYSAQFNNDQPQAYQNDEALLTIKCFFERQDSLRRSIERAPFREPSASNDADYARDLRMLRQTASDEGWLAPIKPHASEAMDRFRITFPQTAARFYFARLTAWIDRICEKTTLFLDRPEPNTFKALRDCYESFRRAQLSHSPAIQNPFTSGATPLGNIVKMARAFCNDSVCAANLTHPLVIEGVGLWARALRLTLDWDRWNTPGAQLLPNAVLKQRPTVQDTRLARRLESDQFSLELTPISIDSMANHLAIIRACVAKAEARNQRFLPPEATLIFKQYSSFEGFGALPGPQVYQDMLELQACCTSDSKNVGANFPDPYRPEELRDEVEGHGDRVIAAYRGQELIALLCAGVYPSSKSGVGAELCALLKSAGIIGDSPRQSAYQSHLEDSEPKPRPIDTSLLVIVKLLCQKPGTQFLYRSFNQTPHALVHQQLITLLQSEHPFEAGGVTCVGICFKRYPDDPVDCTTHENLSYKAFLETGWRELEGVEYTSKDGLVHRVLYFKYNPSAAYR